MYDYIIVGSGLFGSIFAYEANKAGKKVLVLEKREHTGGNIYCENIDGITVHKYGAHIFHTSNKEIWDYINQFAEFNNYINSPIAIYKDEVYNLPFNMNTFSKMFNIKKPNEAFEKISQEKQEIKEPTNLEEQAISLVGRTIYEKLIKGYTEKQWGKDCKDLPVDIIKRLPVRYTYNNNYFNDKYQGIPIGGYNQIIDKLLEGIEVRTNVDYLLGRDEWNKKARKIIYTGQIDAYYDYELGELEYRSLRFETEKIGTINYQGNAVVNYTDKDIPYTRIIEHKHFDNVETNNTIITREYPDTYDRTKIAYYPINNDKNNVLYNAYKNIKNDKVIFCGRLGSYKYYDMDKTIEEALKLVREVIK